MLMWTSVGQCLASQNGSQGKSKASSQGGTRCQPQLPQAGDKLEPNRPPLGLHGPWVLYSDPTHGPQACTLPLIPSFPILSTYPSAFAWLLAGRPFSHHLPILQVLFPRPECLGLPRGCLGHQLCLTNGPGNGPQGNVSPSSPQFSPSALALGSRFPFSFLTFLQKLIKEEVRRTAGNRADLPYSPQTPRLARPWQSPQAAERQWDRTWSFQPREAPCCCGTLLLSLAPQSRRDRAESSRSEPLRLTPPQRGCSCS